MDKEACLACLAALSQPTRLDALRLLARHEPQGLPADALSAHLNFLSHARLGEGRAKAAPSSIAPISRSWAR